MRTSPRYHHFSPVTTIAVLVTASRIFTRVASVGRRHAGHDQGGNLTGSVSVHQARLPGRTSPDDTFARSYTSTMTAATSKGITTIPNSNFLPATPQV